MGFGPMIFALKERRPRPLDDGATQLQVIASKFYQKNQHPTTKISSIGSLSKPTQSTS